MKIKNLASIVLIATLGLYGCGGGSSSDPTPEEEIISISYNSGDLYAGIPYEIKTSNITSLSVNIGTITPKSENQNTQDMVWLYTVPLESLAIPLNVNLTYTTSNGETKTQEIVFGNENSKDKSTDPLLVQQWHIKNYGKNFYQTTIAPTLGIDLNIPAAWRLIDEDGSHITGKNIKVGVIDTPVDIKHEDLKNKFFTPNVDSTKNINIGLSLELLKQEDAYAHGTAVTGILTAEANNGLGGRGIAFDSKFASFNFFTSDISDDLGTFLLSKDIMLVNASVGIDLSTNNKNPMLESYLFAMFEDNKPFIHAMGNEFFDNKGGYSFCINESYVNEVVNCEFKQTSSLDSFPYNINVAAMNSSGEHSSYSSTGSNLWVSALGGEFGNNGSDSSSPAIVTTLSSYEPTDFDDWDKETNWRNENNKYYTSMMNGTSSATPETTSIVALMLQANKELTVPQIRYILAKSARNDLLISSMNRETIKNTDGFIIDNGWQTNSANWRFSNYYGFGLVDAEAAVKLALNCDEDVLCVQKQKLPTEYVSNDNRSCKNIGFDDSLNLYTVDCFFTNFVDENKHQMEGKKIIDNAMITISGIPYTFSQYPITKNMVNKANALLQLELVSPSNTTSIIKNLYSNWDFNSMVNLNTTSKYATLTTSQFYHEEVVADDLFTFRFYSQYPINVDELNKSKNFNLTLWVYDN